MTRFRLGDESVIQSTDNLLFNGWKLTPAGRHVGINALPLKMAISPDGKTLTAVCSARWNGVALIDLQTEQTKQWVPLERTFNGLAFSTDGKKLFVSGGSSDALYVMDFADGKVDEAHLRTVHLGQHLPAQAKATTFSPASPSIPKPANSTSATKAPAKSGWSIPSAKSARPNGRPAPIHMPARSASTANFFSPATGATNPSAPSTWKPASRHCASTSACDPMRWPSPRMAACSSPAPATTPCTSSRRSAPVRYRSRCTHRFLRSRRRSDALEIHVDDVVRVRRRKDRRRTRVAVSPDGKSLFVANADNNDVMVADIADREARRVVGFVPVGWYPCAVASRWRKTISSPTARDSIPRPRRSVNIARRATSSAASRSIRCCIRWRGSVSIIDPPTARAVKRITPNWCA